MAKTAAAKAEVVDEYDLATGEVTKEQFVDQMPDVKTFRTIENWVRDGLITQVKLRRRDPVTGKVRSMPIFMQDDIDKLKEERNKAEVTRTAKPGALAMVAGQASPEMHALAFIARAVGGGGLDPDREPFIPIAQAAEEYKLSVPGILQLAEAKLIIIISGKNGKHMVSRRQLENI